MNDLKYRQDDNPRTPEEDEELRQLAQRIEERLKAIGCPSHYSKMDSSRDSSRLHSLNMKEKVDGSLTEAERDEENQLEARIAAYAASPEGRLVSRVYDLDCRDDELTADERKELTDILAQYPRLAEMNPLEIGGKQFIRALKHAEQEFVAKENEELRRRYPSRRWD